MEMAQVDVQNKIKAVEARLPQVVRQQGLQVEASSSGFLMLVGINSPNNQYSEVDLSDYLVRNVVEELKRVEGVGRFNLSVPRKLCVFGSTRISLFLTVYRLVM